LNNFRNVTVAEAQKKGVKWLFYPSYFLLLFFFFLIPAILMYVFRDSKNDIVLIVGSITSILLGILLPILWNSINSTKYKIWVAENVKDIHRFHEESVRRNLIASKGSFLEKIEIKSRNKKLELEKYYNRLKETRVVGIERNDLISNETIFRTQNTLTIIIFSVLLIGIYYLYHIGEYKGKFVLVFGIIGLSAIVNEFYKKYKYKFVLKINNELISYKDDKEIIYWKDILHFDGIPGIHQNNPSKLVFETSQETYTLILDGFGKIRLDKVINILNEYKYRFDVKNKRGVQQ
jgi:hypothetical protein